MVLLLCLLFYFLYKCGNLDLFSFFEGEGGGPKAPLVLLILRFTMTYSWHI